MVGFDESFMVLLLALAIDAVLGYPQALFRASGHPVTWIGWLIGWLDDSFNRETDTFESRRLAGILALMMTLAIAVGGAGLIDSALRQLLPSILATGAVALLASSLLAQRSLDDHVRAVADALEQGGVEAGRKAVSMIVGRDPERLDEAGICRAAIESLAESASDGVVAPALWIAVGGLAGGAFYKAVNTADSMIGHRTPRHEAYGWAAARLDDLINLPASRLSALLIAAAAALTPGASARDAIRIALRDARLHKSPNAGWPEAAMAGALGLKLAGPRIYDAELVDSVTMGDGRFEATIDDLRRAIRLSRIAAAIQFLSLAAITLSFVR